MSWLRMFLVLALVSAPAIANATEQCQKTVFGTIFTVERLQDGSVSVDIFRPRIGRGLYRAFLAGRNGVLTKGQDFDGKSFPQSSEREQHFQKLLDEALEACPGK